MEIRIERETKWKTDDIKTVYYVWVNANCTAICSTEAEAVSIVNKIKSSPNKIGSETIFKETI